MRLRISLQGVSRFIQTAAVFGLGALLLTSCSKLKENAEVTAPALTVHSTPFERDTASSDFHAAVLKASSWNITQCAECHGADFKGGRVGKTCYRCHDSYPHFSSWITAVGSPTYHGRFVGANQWQMTGCKVCHGNDYAGGNTGSSCSGSSCHVNRAPEACNTCHGNFTGAVSDTLSWAPPRASNGDTQQSSPGVGAHQPHLLPGGVGAAVRCTECHTLFPNVYDARHLNPSSLVVFDGPLSMHATAVTPNPQWNAGALKCSNTYCHGNFTFRRAASPFQFGYVDSVMVGSNAAPVWNAGGQAQCGSCHGLPPTGHLPEALNACATCHTAIVDANGNIIDPSKHINGKINVFTREY